MRILRADEVQSLGADVPTEPATLRPQWVEGPHHGDRLDVGLVTLSAGAVTPPHIHIGGQVIVVTDGRGFVETEAERVEVAAGDVVISPPGETHTHGALEDSTFSHLTVTTGGYRFPEAI